METWPNLGVGTGSSGAASPGGRGGKLNVLNERNPTFCPQQILIIGPAKQNSINVIFLKFILSDRGGHCDCPATPL
jgi:hypothetical protein